MVSKEKLGNQSLLGKKQTGFEVEAAKTLFLFCFVFSLLFSFFLACVKAKIGKIYASGS